MPSLERLDFISTIPYKLAGAVAIGSLAIDSINPDLQTNQIAVPAALATVGLWMGRVVWGGIVLVAQADRDGAVSGRPERMR